MFLMLSTIFGFTERKDRLKYWNKETPLSWEDFNGIPKRIDQIGAVCTSGVVSSIEVIDASASIECRAVFYRRKSWVKEHSKDIAGLEHEQGHFDISEIFARRFKQKMSESGLTVKNASRKYEKTLIEIEEQRKAYQIIYDKETQHHLNEQKQKEWNQRISMELDDLKEFSEPKIALILPRKKKCKK
jgi:hypothetical protein